MAAKRILIISSFAMFGHGLESLLRGYGQIEVVGQEKKIAVALEQISRQEPDVVILDSDDPSTNTVPLILSHVSKENIPITLIELSLNSNKLHFYATNQWEVNGVDDLVKAITPAADSAS